MKTVYKLGDIVSCHGEGNPKPKYRWTSKYGVVKEGSDLAITYDLTVRTMLISCTGSISTPCIGLPSLNMTRPF